MNLLIALSVAFFCKFNPAAAKDLQVNLPRVAIKQGVLVGTTKVSAGGREFDSFEGVPYAEPPVGKYRFKEPQAPKKWKGVFNASKIGNSCMQYNHHPPKPYAVIGEEDCLIVNIYRPRGSTAGQNHPVVIFIHGGAWMFNYGAQANPQYLLDRDIVYINFNYRLGPLGFLSTGDDVVPGNNGLKDQSAALRWVKENIHEFGGDSNSITIIGLSAGGASVHYHYLSPLSKGLFARGISFSGTALVPWAQIENVVEKTRQVAARLGCPSNDNKRMVKCLQNQPARDIVAAMEMFQPFLYNPFSPFGPVVEHGGSNPFIAKHPVDIIKNRKSQDLPWIATIVNCEGLYPAAEFVFSSEYLPALENNWFKYAPHVLDYNFTIPLSQQNSVSKKTKRQYLGDKKISKETFPELVQMVGDRLFVAPIEQTVRLQAATTVSPIHFYKFLYRGQHSLSEIFSGGTEDYGVSHADDVNYLFGFLENGEKWAADVKMTTLMVDFLEKFARNGTIKFGNLKWEPIVPHATNLKYLEIRNPEEYSMTSSSDLGHRQFWESVPFEENQNIFVTNNNNL